MIVSTEKQPRKIGGILRDDRSPVCDRVGDDVLIPSSGANCGNDRFDVVASGAQAREQLGLRTILIDEQAHDGLCAARHAANLRRPRH